jgi:hypothetical protein
VTVTFQDDYYPRGVLALFIESIEQDPFPFRDRLAVLTLRIAGRLNTSLTKEARTGIYRNIGKLVRHVAGRKLTDDERAAALKGGAKHQRERGLVIEDDEGPLIKLALSTVDVSLSERE